MKGNTTYGFLLGAVVIGAIAGVLHYTNSSSAQVSKPEIIFEVPKKDILECEYAGQAGTNKMVRCTDKDRDATCYVLRPEGSSPALSCLPNQWLNYPQSTANVNAENF